MTASILSPIAEDQGWENASAWGYAPFCGNEIDSIASRKFEVKQKYR
jgi:hypothetical protein